MNNGIIDDIIDRTVIFYDDEHTAGIMQEFSSVLHNFLSIIPGVDGELHIFFVIREIILFIFGKLYTLLPDIFLRIFSDHDVAVCSDKLDACTYFTLRRVSRKTKHGLINNKIDRFIRTDLYPSLRDTTYLADEPVK